MYSKIDKQKIRDLKGDKSTNINFICSDYNACKCCKIVNRSFCDIAVLYGSFFRANY